MKDFNRQTFQQSGLVARITYTVLVETLNPAQSINQSISNLATV